jgi:YfiH family protein
LSLVAFSTESRHGDARAPGALARLLRSQKLPVSFACSEQVHDAKIAIVPRLAKAKKYTKADGLLTEHGNQPLTIFTADCAPVFLSAENGRVLGLLHAGWRGVQRNILREALRLLWRKWRIKPANVHVWTGPHIRACCFEVQWDVARYFPTTRRRSKDRWKINLEGELRHQARRLGVGWMSKKASCGCTMHESRFFSYRRNQTAKRQVSVIMKRDHL